LGQTKKVWRQLPNAMTILRLVLIVVFVIFFYYFDRDNKEMLSRSPWMIASMAVYALACITDFLDGWIARKFNLISDTGKLMDPLADKLMLIIIMFCFWLRAMDMPSAESNMILPIWVIIVLAAKEVIMVVGGMILYVKDVIVHSKFLGKLGTAILMVGVGLAFLWEYLGGWHLYVIYAGLVVTIAGFFQYGIDTIIRSVKAKKEKAAG
jgi:cardiolipin synthase (CMP-forming)